MRTAAENDLVLLVSRDGKRQLLKLHRGYRFQTHKGYIAHDDLIDEPLGRQVCTHLGEPFLALRPSLYDLLMNVKRSSQIVYPKEIGQILLRLDICNGKRVIEAGTGSGVLTIALAHSIKPEGMVYSYEIREDMIRVARQNLKDVGLSDYVQLGQRDVAQGFDQTEVDALFLDMREPWDYLAQVCEALADGGFFGALVPTTNQVSWLLREMVNYPLTSIEVMEVLLRKYKPVPARLRPQDKMIGHTGFLIFARKVATLGDTLVDV